MIASKLEWNKAIKTSNVQNDLILNFLECLTILAKNCPSDRKSDFYEESFLDGWEFFIDKF